jgi:hypothetical protein
LPSITDLQCPSAARLFSLVLTRRRVHTTAAAAALPLCCTLRRATRPTGLDGRVKALKDEFGSRTREAETLRAGLERAQATLDKAQSLLGQLGGEQVRALPPVSLSLRVCLELAAHLHCRS